MKRKVSEILAVVMAIMITITTVVPTNVYAAQASGGGTEDVTVSDNDTLPEKEISESKNIDTETDVEEVSSEEKVSDALDSFGEEGKLNFLYLENKLIETPGEQNVLVGFGDADTVITSGVLEVQNYKTKEISTYFSEDALDNSILFNMDFLPDQKGIYEVIGVTVRTEDGKETKIRLSDTGIDNVYFGVDEEIVESEEGVDPSEASSIEMQIVSFDENASEVKTESITAAVEEVLEEAAADPELYSAVAPIAALSNTPDPYAAGGKLVVVLDPGHDAAHAGTRANNLKEEELTLKIAQYCKAELEQYSGVSVYMTRNSASCPYPGTTSTVDNYNRVEYAKSVGADIYVSIHLNSAATESAKGAEVYYPNANYNSSIGTQGANLATQILRQLKALGLTDRGIKIRESADGTTYPDGSLADYYGVIKNSKLAGFPGVIIEHAFVTNSSDAAFLSSEANLQKIGVADATGIANYLNLVKGGITASAVWVQTYKNEAYKGSFVVQIDGVQPLDKVKGVKVVAFTKPDGSDIAWYDAIYYGNSTYAITIDSDYHNRNSGFYIAEAYAETYSGEMQSLGITYCMLTFSQAPAPTAADVAFSNINSGAGTFDVSISNIKAEAGVKSVRTVIQTPGASNAYSYAASAQNGAYVVKANIKNHQNVYGTYQVSVYVTDSYGREVCVATKNVSINRPAASMTMKQGDGYETITLSGLGIDGSVSSALFAVWSEENGRDDLALYEGQKQQGNVWTVNVPIRNHKSTGKYTVQAGIVDPLGNLGWISEGTFNVEGPKGGVITPANVDNQMGEFDVIVSGVQSAAGISKIKLEVWCTGTDDKYTYDTFAYNGSFLAHVSSANHKYHYGTYTIRAIAEDNNGMEATVATKTVKVSYPTPFLGITQNADQTQFGLVASNLGNPQGIADVVFAVWSDENGRDDFRMYSAYSPSNGVYISSVNIKDHASYGDYTVQLGVIYKDGSIRWCVDDGFTVERPKMSKMEFGAFYDVQNTFYVRVYGVTAPAGVKSVIIPVWSKSDQSDIYFYQAALQSDGSYLLLGNTSAHQFSSGTYYAQVYIEDYNGITSFVGIRTCQLQSVDTSLYPIMGRGYDNVQQMMNYYNSKTTYPAFYADSDAPTLQDFCQMYIDECNMEGVNPEVAFVQAMKETNFLRYTGDVRIEQYNFAGIGATGGGEPGNSFENVRTGIRAQVQHLKAYATTDPLVNPCVDPRYTYVKKGSAPYVQWLGIKENPYGAGWATAVNYGYSIVDMIRTLKTY